MKRIDLASILYDIDSIFDGKVALRPTLKMEFSVIDSLYLAMILNENYPIMSTILSINKFLIGTTWYFYSKFTSCVVPF